MSKTPFTTSSGKNQRICTVVYGEMVDFGVSDKMIKISGKVDKSNNYRGVIFRSLFKEVLLRTNFFL